MQDARLQLTERNVMVVEAWAVDAVKRALKGVDDSELASAYLTYNDILPSGIIKAVQERGLLIPQDINVIGERDTFIATTFSPELTSIDYLDQYLINNNVQILLSRIQGDHSPIKMISLYAKLIVRKPDLKVLEPIQVAIYALG